MMGRFFSGKFEQLIVAAQEIAASTAQLFVSSRVKADRDSEKYANYLLYHSIPAKSIWKWNSRMSALSTTAKNVNQCTARVVAAVKNGQTTLNDKGRLLLYIHSCRYSVSFCPNCNSAFQITSISLIWHFTMRRRRRWNPRLVELHRRVPVGTTTATALL